MISPDDPLEDSSSENVIQRTQQFGHGSIRQAFSRWWIILLFGILGYSTSLYYMSVAPPNLEAVAVMEVNLTDRKVMGAELERERLQSEIAIATVVSKMMGPAILAAAAESPEVQALKELIPPEFSLKPRYWRPEEELRSKPASAVSSEEIISRMVEDWVSVSGRRNTSLIEVRVSHPDSESARVIANTILKVYIEKERGLKSGGATEAYKILKAEADDSLISLQQAEQSIQIYVSALRLNEQIQESRADRIAMRQRYKVKHPKMIQAEAAYLDVYQRFRKEILRASQSPSERGYWLEYNSAMTSLDEKIKAAHLPSTISHQPSSISHQPSAISHLPSGSQMKDEWLSLVQNALSSRASRLNGRIQHEQALYQSITRRMTEINLSEESAHSKVIVVEPAFIGRILETTRLIYIATGLVVGLMSGFGVAFLIGFIDYKIYDVPSVEAATGISCLSAIPASDLFGRSLKWESVFVDDPHSSNAEAIRNLRASILLLGRSEHHRTLLLTSSVPGEGKTTIAAELAIAFGLNQERTLLIDFDLRRPRMSELFPETKGKPGIVDVLAGQADLQDVIHPSEHQNLYLLGSGSKAPNPAELLQRKELAALFKAFAKDYDRIIIDSAPILAVSDSRLLSSHAQSVILVVRASKAPIGAVIRASSQLTKSNAKVVGLVLNGMKRKVSAPSYSGYNGYGEYSSDGYYGEEDV